MMLYIGLKEKAKPVIFESEKEPNKETHPQYDVIYGPSRACKLLKGTLPQWTAGLPAVRVEKVFS